MYKRIVLIFRIIILLVASSVSAQQTPTPTPLPPTARVVSLATPVDLRDGPFERSRVIRQVPGGTEIVIIAVTADQNWYRVRLPDNRTGWLAAEFLTEIPPTSTPSIADEVSHLNMLGEVAILQGKFTEALQFYTQAIGIDSSSKEAYEGRGNVYLSLEQYSQALEDFTRALELGPASSQLYTSFGIAYLNLGQYEQALSNLDLAIERNPRNYLAYSIRGIHYYTLMDYEEALVDFNRAIELAPDTTDSANLYVWRALVYINNSASQDQIRADFCLHVQLAGNNADPSIIDYIEDQGWACQ